MRLKYVALLISVLMFCGYAKACDFSAVCESGQTLYYNITSYYTEPYTVEVVRNGNINQSGDLIIPETVEYNGVTYSVSSIGYMAFRGCFGLTSVTNPNSVTSIGEYAFCSCSGLTSVIIGNSVTSIGNHAFYGCSGLTSVTIPNSVTSIGGYAFYGCSGLTGTLTIPESVTSMGSSVFYNCSGLTHVNFNATNCTAMSHCFSGCTSITSLNIGENVTNIPDCAFDESSGLTSVTIPNSVTNIGYKAFSACTGLTSVTFGNSVTSIGESAFYDCTVPISITIPNSVTSIGRNAFFNVKNIVYGGSATGSPWGALTVNGIIDGDFIYSDTARTNLTAYIGEGGSVVIPSSVVSIGVEAFFCCRGLSSVVIPNSVTSIGSSAFSGCSGLSSVVIPNSVTSIGNSAFSGCSGLNTVNFNATNCTTMGSYSYPVFQNSNANAIINIGEGVTTIPDEAFSGLLGNDILIIPNSVTSIGVDAFYGCSGLTSVTIGNSVTSIGHSAFFSCSGLTSVTIPSSVTSIGMDAFCYCERLTSVTIPSSVTSIGEGAFIACIELTDIFVDSPVPPSVCNSNTFSGCLSATLWVPCGYAGVYETTAIWSDFNDIRESRAYLLSVESNNNIWGTANVTQQPNCDDGIAVISATPNNHCYFVQWSDGNTDNPRTVVVEGDTTYTAMFAIDQHTITVLSNDENLGSVVGGGTYDYGTEIQILATASEGYAFLSWDDGNTDNPRTIIVEGDTTFTAIFATARTVTIESSDSEMGYVIGSGIYAEGAVVDITAVPYEGYIFDHWVDVYNPSRDFNTDNPRTIVVSSDLTYMAVFTDVTGIENDIVPEISVFPNPANDILNITSSETISEIEIVNMNGQVVRRIEVNSDNAVCNVDDLRSGMYVVRIRTLRQAQGAFISQRKFEKE